MMLPAFVITWVILVLNCRMAEAEAESIRNAYTLDSVREALIRQEDTIVFNVIERAKYPINSHTYREDYTSNIPGFCGSILEFIVKDSEAIQAKAGRYSSPEENPFFPENLPLSSVPDYPFLEILHPAAATVNINKFIWKVYFKEMLPSFAASGDDGNYAQTAASDLLLLQAISRRIHFGKFVAEVKYRESPQDYEPAIRAQDRKALMKLLTFVGVEEMVKKRVEKKAMVFGQEVSLGNDVKGNYKVDPSVLSRLYDKWLIPLTKDVEVKYLLRRLQ